MVEATVTAPVIPVPPAATTPEPTGREMLKAAIPAIDYSETFDDEVKPVVEEPKKEEPKVEEKKVDPKEKLLEQALIRQRIAEVEAERAKAERDLLYRQRLEQAQMQQMPAPQQNEPTKEQLVAMYQDDPFAVIEMISQRVAEETKKKTIAEMTQQDQQQQYVQDLQSKRQQFQANVQKIVAENPQLMNPEDPLAKHIQTIEKEFPGLLMDPEGPVKGLELAKQRLELEQLKAQKVVTPVVEEGKGTEPARETVRVASMVTGPSRGVPPSPSVKLTKEEELAARKMRITPEQFASYKERSPKYFQKEQAPKRRVG